MSITQGPLKGIRVIDMTHAHAGPFGTMLLGDLGAEIIKLEPPPGEMMRMGEKKVSLTSYYFTGLNRNKKGLVLDLKGELGRKAFHELVKKSDIVYSNLRAGVPTRQGTDFETLSKINPRIIRCNISGYGETGPCRSYPSFDIIACGHSGILSVSGDPKTNTPVIPGGIALADMMGGIFGTMSVLAALFKRNRDDKGVKIEFNLLNGLMVMQQVLFQNYFLTGNNPPLQGQRHSTTAAYGIFDTKDGHITLAPVKQTDKETLLKLIGLEKLLNDPKFKTREDMIMNRIELNEHIEKALLKRNTDEWVKLFRDENDIPCGPVLNYDQIITDPQVLHNKMFIEMELRGERYKTIGTIFKLSNESELIQGTPDPPPDLDEHTDEILQSLLGYSDETIKAIRAESEAAIPIWKARSSRTDMSEHIDELKQKIKESQE
ncbi:MAG: CoA transferase [Spirochaetota bacterium]|nr:CoA transferase [Spirochaetota bacterium]